MTNKDRNSGKCIRCMAEPATLEEWYEEKALQGYPVSREYPLGPNTIVVRQKGNGSVRLVSVIGRGALKPTFVIPRPYPRIGEPGFPKAKTDLEGLLEDEAKYLRSIGG